jgi:hypothetical protein
VRTHFLAEMGDYVAVCGSEDDRQTYFEDAVTCPDCKDEIR